LKARHEHQISKIVQKFLPDVEAQGGISGYQRSILKLISLCKTSALGGHKEACPSCQYDKIHYNSCGNRNCPSCQGVNKEKWVFDRQYDLLPVTYFHSVFTIPSELYIYFKYNKRILYDLLMRSVKETLDTFGKNERNGIGGKIGAILLLHTWTQQMGYHPHVHCIVPAGGLTPTGKWQQAKAKGQFLFSVRAMSVMFRGKLLAGIHQLYLSGKLRLPKQELDKYKKTKANLYLKEFVSYAKPAFGGPRQVLEYIGRYTHRICISNHRIIKITKTHVTFRYLDRKKKKSKTKTVTGQQFIKLFAEHILPKGFVKIRHIGFLSSRSKAKDLAVIRKSLCVKTPAPKVKMTNREFMTLTTGKDPHLCPKCGEAEMVVTLIMPPIRGSPFKIYQRPIPKDRIVKIRKPIA